MKTILTGIHRWRSLWAELSKVEGICLLGPSPAAVRRLPILSLLIRAFPEPTAPFLHHNFAAALLDNLFGIQVKPYPILS